MLEFNSRISFSGKSLLMGKKNWLRSDSHFSSHSDGTTALLSYRDLEGKDKRGNRIFLFLIWWHHLLKQKHFELFYNTLDLDFYDNCCYPDAGMVVATASVQNASFSGCQLDSLKRLLRGSLLVLFFFFLNIVQIWVIIWCKDWH